LRRSKQKVVVTSIVETSRAGALQKLSCAKWSASQTVARTTPPSTRAAAPLVALASGEHR
jgi:hypothetical protein